MSCPFCTRPDDLPDRIFYEDADTGWFAFLSAPPHTSGHTILAALPRDKNCPQAFEIKTLRGIDRALCDVVAAIKECYAPHIHDVLMASLRGDVRHFHLHLLPLWPEEEKQWRSVTGYPDSHFMEFMGALEKKHDFKLRNSSKPEKGQRLASNKDMIGEINALRKITRYQIRT